MLDRFARQSRKEEGSMPLSQHHNESLTAHESIVRDFFDREAESYSRFYSGSTRTGSAVLFQERLALAVEMTRGSRGALLECACGTGEITRAVICASSFDNVVINDVSPTMIKRCRDALRDCVPPNTVKWREMSVADLPDALQANSFDVVLCLGLIAHCGNLSVLMRKLAYLLKTGGAVLVQSTLLDRFGNRLSRLISQEILRRGEYKMESYYLKDIMDQAAAAGLRQIEIRRFGVCLPFGDRLIGKANYWLEKNFAMRCRRNGGEVLILFRKVA
jgi:ubiquinone/menaquinone biosynthesis C-methylase UbiE